MKKPKIELKNIKINHGLSQETHAYTATVYVDGKRWAMASNHGCGGPDDVSPLKSGTATYREIRKELQELNVRIGETYPPYTFDSAGLDPMKQDLETVCGELLNRHLIRKEYKRLNRKYLLFTTSVGPGVYQITRTKEDTAEHKKRIRKQYDGETLTFLEDLPEEEAETALRSA